MKMQVEKSIKKVRIEDAPSSRAPFKTQTNIESNFKNSFNIMLENMNKNILLKYKNT